jgi:hypothetical protein
LTNEIHEIESTLEDLKKMVHYIIFNKYTSETIDNETFMSQNLKRVAKYNLSPEIDPPKNIVKKSNNLIRVSGKNKIVSN